MTAYIDFRAVVLDILTLYPTSNLFFLIDHAGMPGLNRQLGRSSVIWDSLFEGTKEDKALLAAPILILGGVEGKLEMPRSLLEWIGINGTFTSTVSLLVSPLPIDSMRRRLAARLKVRLSENMDALLRFFDPRILESLIKTLRAEQADVFFSPAESWRYVDRAGRILEIKSGFDRQDSFSEPLVLDKAQEFTLLEECDANLIMELICENMPQFFKNISLSEKYESISQAVSSARLCGLDSIMALTLYTAAILLQGRSVTKEPFWPDFVGALKNYDFESVGSLSIFQITEI